MASEPRTPRAISTTPAITLVTDATPSQKLEALKECESSYKDGNPASNFIGRKDGLFYIVSSGLDFECPE
jgi:hypothetical protein